MQLYGIKACDTCRKALKELTATGHKVTFVDVRAEPVSPAELAKWFEALGPDLVNRRSTTWKALSEDERSQADTSDGAVTLLSAHPTLMKRPVLDAEDALYLGWTPQTRAALGS
ncbi:MAG: arsenate reductase family protein [Paracoccaceae bacterium]